MTLIIKAIFGALIVIAISLISSTKNYFLAGLIPLFPTFALIAHIIVGQKGTMELKNTALFGMLSLIPYLAYLLSIYFLSGRVPLWVNLLLSVVVWVLFALIIYILWTKFKI